MLVVKDLHKFYGGFHAVRGISFELKDGEVLGFLGPNGAGKTTTMKIITGFLAMTSGDVTVDGLDVVGDSLEVRRRLGYLPENAPLYDDMTVTEYLNFVCDVRGLKGQKRRERIGYVTDVCALGAKRRAVIKTLSKGYRQRVGLAQSIIHEPKLVILDEPTVGLDPNQIIEIRELIRAVGRDNTVILSSHILAEVEATCSRVIIIDHGEIVADDKPAQLGMSHAEPGRYRLTIAVKDVESIDLASIDFGDTIEILARSKAPGQVHLDVKTTDVDGFMSTVLRTVALRQWTLVEATPERPTLEQVFRKLTNPQKATTPRVA